MSVVGFNSGLSDQLQSIMDARLKAQQQAFENDLATKEEARKQADEQRKQEAHDADLADRQAARALVVGEKTSTDLGPGALITTPGQLQALQAGNQSVAQPTMPITPGISGVTQMPSASGVVTTPGAGAVSGISDDTTPVPDATAPPPPPPPPPALPPGPLGTLNTQTVAPTPTGPINVGTAAAQQALKTKQGWLALGNQLWGDDTDSKQLFGQLMAQGLDPKSAIDATKAIKDKGPAGAKPTQAEGLFNPANHNAVVFDPGGAQGAGYYDSATHAFVPAPSHYQSGDPAMRSIAMELAQQRLAGAQALAQAPVDIYNGIRSGDTPAVSTGLARAGTWALVEAEAARQAKNDKEAGRTPFSLPEAIKNWQGALRLTQSLNSPAQVSMSQSIVSTDHALTLIDSLANQWDSAGVGPLSRARLEMAKQGIGDFANLDPAKRLAAQSLANRLSAEINDVTLNLGSVYGRGTPTDATRQLAGENIKDWWAKGTIHDLVDQSRWNLNNISLAMRSNQVNTGGGPTATPPLPAASAPASPKFTSSVN